MKKIGKALTLIIVCVSFALPLAISFADNHSKLVTYDYEGNTFVVRKLSCLPSGYTHTASTIDTANRSARHQYKNSQNHYIELRQQTRAIVMPNMGNAIILSDGKYNYILVTDDPDIDNDKLKSIAEGINPPLGM